MLLSPFKIYNASAGSGKTHTLTKEYLKIILTTKKSYGQILALTFTNKAVAEMKKRILESLYQFSNTNSAKEASPLFLDVQKELGLESLTLQKRAEQTLKDILHNYAFFDISTLDKFTHRIIRTFAKDLKLPQNFEVILDRDLLLNEAVSRLIFKAGKEPLLTKVLLEFAMEKIEDDKSWDIAIDLFNVGKLLFEENHKKHLETFASKTITDFLELKKLLKSRIASREERMSNEATRILSVFTANKLAFNHFNASYYPKFMLQISERNFKINFDANWKQQFDSKPLYAKKCDENVKTILDGLHTEFSRSFQLIKDTFFKYLFLKNAYSSIVPLTVLNSIQQEIKTIQNERDQLSISEFNTIISKEVKNQPAPFIYERLGEKYRHYFIDEFQDTSVMQWENLQPLIDNALASEDEKGQTGSLFLVGDTKQAIYRWRGGRAEQFLRLTNNEIEPFSSIQQVFPLETNYRSFREIVRFNNSFFQSISAFLNRPDYQKLYVDGNKQLSNAEAGGYIELRFLDEEGEEDKDALYGTAVLETIAKVDPTGTAYNNICILVRSNRHGVALASFLTQNSIPIISTESLLVNSSKKVQFLINLLRFLNEPGDVSISFSLLRFLSKEIVNRHDFITANLYDVNSLFIKDYNFKVATMPQKSVFDILELAIKQFDLAPETDVYLVSLMDFVLDVENKEGAGMYLFLDHWEKKKEKLSISAPAMSNAVRIMTIHKAKGLEFPIVIFPYANEDIYRRNDKKIWLPIDSDEYNGFDRILVSEKNEIIQYSEEANLIFQEEEEKMELDAFNILYVALTRAEHSLFIISKKELSKTNDHNPKHYSGLFIHFLKEKGLWNAEQNLFSFGKLEEAQKTESQTPCTIPYQYTYKNRANFKILAASGSLWDTNRETAIADGNLLHDIMSHIETKDDVKRAVALFSRKGDLSVEKLSQIQRKIKNITSHPQLEKYFDKGLSIKNEKDIITQNGRLLRPDRLVFDNNTVTVIDYKTGKKNPTYHQQVYIYADALEDMGYLVADKIIVYSNETVTPEFI